MNTNELKTFIKEECGDPAVGICDVSDLSTSQVEALHKTNTTMAKYSLIFDPGTPVLHPREFLDNARSALVVGSNAFFGRPELPGSPPRGEIMNFFVNQDCVVYSGGVADRITTFFTNNGYQAAYVANGLPLKIMSARSGLGTYGKNGIILAPGKGSWLALNVIITDAELEPDEPLGDVCGDCTKCQEACPTHALDTPYTCDIEKCITLHTIYNQIGIPETVQDNMGTRIAHCNACLDACPKNKNLPLQTEVSLPDELVYPEIAPLLSMTEEVFQEKYGGSFLEFVMMDKKYLQRNAAIALGNYGDKDYAPTLFEALKGHPEEIVRCAAARSLGKLQATEGLDRFLADPSPVIQKAVISALEGSEPQ
jgi:epoxyqueuosine reductase QueG